MQSIFGYTLFLLVVIKAVEVKDVKKRDMEKLFNLIWSKMRDSAEVPDFKQISVKKGMLGPEEWKVHKLLSQLQHVGRKKRSVNNAIKVKRTSLDGKTHDILSELYAIGKKSGAGHIKNKRQNQMLMDHNLKELLSSLHAAGRKRQSDMLTGNNLNELLSSLRKVGRKRHETDGKRATFIINGETNEMLQKLHSLGRREDKSQVMEKMHNTLAQLIKAGKKRQWQNDFLERNVKDLTKAHDLILRLTKVGKRGESINLHDFLQHLHRSGKRTDVSSSLHDVMSQLRKIGKKSFIKPDSKERSAKGYDDVHSMLRDLHRVGKRENKDKDEPQDREERNHSNGKLTDAINKGVHDLIKHLHHVGKRSAKGTKAPKGDLGVNRRDMAIDMMVKATKQRQLTQLKSTLLSMKTRVENDVDYLVRDLKAMIRLLDVHVGYEIANARH